jgi:hypothetical protein
MDREEMAYRALLIMAHTGNLWEVRRDSKTVGVYATEEEARAAFEALDNGRKQG